MQITIKGNPQKIAAFVVGLQERQRTSLSGTEARVYLVVRKVAVLAAVHTSKEGISRREWDELFTQTDSTDHTLSECQE